MRVETIRRDVLRDRIPIKMYTPMNNHAWERYFNCHGQDDEIKRLSIEGNYKSVTEKINDAPEKERKALIEKYLNSNKAKFQEEAAEMIGNVPAEERKSLIEKCLIIDNVKVQKVATEAIWCTPTEERKSLIEKALKIDNVEVQEAAVEIINYAPEEERRSLIEKALNIDNFEIKKAAAKKIWCVNREETLKLKNKVKEIIDKTFDSGNIEDCKVAAEMIDCAPEVERFDLKYYLEEIIDKTFDSGNIEDCKLAAEMIKHAPKKEYVSLIEKALNIDNVEVQKVVAKIIGLKPFGFIEEKMPLIEKALNTNNVEVQKVIAEMIWWMNEKNKLLIMKRLSPEAANSLIRPPLYDNSKLTKQKLERENFEKTGSKTTLVGGTLLGESIVRHIKPQAFLAWQKTYEDYETWQKAGFDYVPIEPIQSYTLDKNEGLVRVFSEVLDLSLANWEIISSLFKSELRQQKDRIINVLTSQDILHGHTNDNNFILSFYRNEDGSVNFDRCPRLYAIDFDKATSK